MNKFGAPRHPTHRCRGCDHWKTTAEFRVLPCGDRSRRCKACEAVKAKRVELRHANGPSDFAPSEKVCAACAGLSHRVVGPRCRSCGLLYADEPAQVADFDARNPSALARAM